MPSVLFEKRQYGYGNSCGYGYYGDGYGGCSSSWNRWARWVVLAVVIIGVLFLFFLFSCISARRRRKMGAQPYRGTGWALGRTPPGHGPATYNQQPYYAQPGNENYQQAAAPPAYGASQDYYGGRNNDVELQQPQATYGGYNQGYAPPSGPPPPKTRY